MHGPRLYRVSWVKALKPVKIYKGGRYAATTPMGRALCFYFKSFLSRVHRRERFARISLALKWTVKEVATDILYVAMHKLVIIRLFQTDFNVSFRRDSDGSGIDFL